MPPATFSDRQLQELFWAVAGEDVMTYAALEEWMDPRGRSFYVYAYVSSLN